MKKLFHQKTILSLIMSVLIIIILIAATIAWFIGFHPIQLMDFDMAADDLGDLYVEVGIEPYDISSEKDGSEIIHRMAIGSINENGAMIDIDLAQLINIEENKIGPGAFGKIHFYITTKTDLNTEYKLSITPTVTITENETITEEEKADSLELLKNHIKFYAEYSKEEGYDEEIQYRNIGEDFVGLEGVLENGVEKEVVIYWYWPYEYTDIPGVVSNIEGIEDQIVQYDLEDTKIGNYIDKVNFQFQVEGRLYGATE